MKKAMNQFFSLVMAMVMMTGLFLPASAAEGEMEPYSSRFRYYTVTDKDWKYVDEFTITKEQSQNYRKMEEYFWKAFGDILGDEITHADDFTSFMNDLITKNNLDYADEGTYTIYTKDKIRYKEHLQTGRKTVEQAQKIIRVDFESTEKSTSRQITVTVR